MIDFEPSNLGESNHSQHACVHVCKVHEVPQKLEIAKLTRQTTVATGLHGIGLSLLCSMIMLCCTAQEIMLKNVSIMLKIMLKIIPIAVN